MTLKNGDRFTVYDAMEAAGVFSTNPANANAVDKNGRTLYKGPVKFPMMLYHPKGEERISVHGVTDANAIRLPGQPAEKFGEQWEIISKEVNSEEELSEALAEGWHKFPAFAIKAANETWRKERGLTALPVPAISAQSRISELEEQNRRLTEMLEEAKRNQEEISSSEFVPPSKAASNVAKAGLV